MKTKVGIIGYGKQGQIRHNAINETGCAEVVAISEPSDVNVDLPNLTGPTTPRYIYPLPLLEIASIIWQKKKNTNMITSTFLKTNLMKMITVSEI